MSGEGKRGPVLRRRVNVAVVETARLEKGLSLMKLCEKANMDPCAYRHFLRYQGERSRDPVLLAIIRTLGLKVADVVTFLPGDEVVS